MRIMLAQINPKVGDLDGNYNLAVLAMDAGQKEGADLVVFPELATIGYPPKDLLEKPEFVDAVMMDYNHRWEALATKNTQILFGSVLRQNGPPDSGKSLRNVAILSDGKSTQWTTKCLLPTYDVFDEARYFSPGEPKKLIFKGKDGHSVRLGVSICEDIWNDKAVFGRLAYAQDPIRQLSPCDVLINLSASPFSLGKPETRLCLLSHVASNWSVPLVYVNQVGGNDDVIYDGRSMVFNSKGVLCHESVSFDSCLGIVDTHSLRPCKSLIETEAAEIHHALVMGLRDYAVKTGFEKAVIGLSGGIDSAVVACLAAKAFGPKNVLGIGMPSMYSSDGSVKDAERLAKNLGIDFKVIPIHRMHAAYAKMLDPFLETEKGKTRLWEENLQARIRGAILMAFSNDQNRLLLSTGNKSEVAMGYCTLYGDTNGGIAVISDVLKTKVYALARYINEVKRVIPINSLDKPPSAELRPNQVDQDSLPPYNLLDFVLEQYIEDGKDAGAIGVMLAGNDGRHDMSLVACNRLVAEIIRKVDANEYKRKQLPPGLRVTKKAFGTGRQMPIAQGWKGVLP